MILFMAFSAGCGASQSINELWVANILSFRGEGSSRRHASRLIPAAGLQHSVPGPPGRRRLGSHGLTVHRLLPDRALIALQQGECRLVVHPGHRAGRQPAHRRRPQQWQPLALGFLFEVSETQQTYSVVTMKC